MDKAFKNYRAEKVKAARSKRDDFISRFQERINAERLGTKFKPLTARVVALKVSHLTIQDLDYFWKQCDKADNFGKVFFGSLKVNK